MSTYSLQIQTPERETTWPSIWIVAAHPDDEAIGLGGQLSNLKDCAVLHLTDGATRADPARADYAAARKSELHSALEVAGIPEDRATSLGIPDQEVSLQLAATAIRLRNLWLETMPDIVFTHPYEGGHPDHDAAAFSVHSACMLLDREGIRPPEIWEFTSYHSGPEGMNVFDFLPSDRDVTTIRLQPDACARKLSMFACYQSQSDMLRNFPVGIEKLRPAPTYDFTAAPHEGRLFYENFDWGMTGERWRALAREALSSFTEPRASASGPESALS